MADLTVDLSEVGRAIDTVNRNIDTVNHNVGVVARQVEIVGEQVDVVAQEQAGTRQLLERFYAEFKDYVDKDEWNNAVSAARENLQLVKGELDRQFGHYDEVRRLALGILQSVDAGIIHEDSIRRAVEEKILTATGYWLPPALVGLAAWVSDDRPLAEKSIGVAIGRDDSKTSLFFSLVCRRLGRMEACAVWLLRYFQTQSPAAMDREVVVMLDGLANGVFGGTALSLCSKVIDEWLAELEQQAGFEPEQRRRWATALDVMTPAVGDGEFPTLRKYSPTWPKLGASLAAARRNQVVQHFFEQMFTGEIVVAPGLEAAVDEILTKLVKNYDDEELPLRREATKHQLVIDVDGMPGSASQKRAEADRRYQAKEESLQVQTNFAAHLTNAAMYQDASGASSATCRYAVSRSRQWVAAGFSDITARDRAAVPSTVDIGCGSWKGSSRDGLDEQRLSADVHSHYASRIEEAVNAVKMTGGTWAAVAIGALFALFIAAQGSGTAFVLALFVLGSVAAYFYFQYQNLDKRRQQARTALETERDGVARVLKAALAELTDLRREIANEDAKADQVLTLLAALSSPQYVLNRPEQARAVIA